MTDLKPRHSRSRAENLRGFNTFLGYAYDLDVFANETWGNLHKGKYLIVCSPKEALPRPSYGPIPYNWDILSQDKDGNLIKNRNDVEVDMPAMVEIYQLINHHQLHGDRQ